MTNITENYTVRAAYVHIKIDGKIVINVGDFIRGQEGEFEFFFKFSSLFSQKLFKNHRLPSLIRLGL